MTPHDATRRDVTQREGVAAGKHDAAAMPHKLIHTNIYVFLLCEVCTVQLFLHSLVAMQNSI